MVMCIPLTEILLQELALFKGQNAREFFFQAFGLQNSNSVKEINDVRIASGKS